MRLCRFDNGATTFVAQSPICHHGIKSDSLNFSNRILGRSAGGYFVTCLFQYFSF